MKEMDCVEVIVEKEKYAIDGVHKGMNGWICVPEKINGYWLVNFPQCGEKHDIATIALKEEDMNLIPVMQAIVNEQIKAQFDETLKKSESNSAECIFKDGEDISDFLV